jgi:hypothetical protein
MTLEEKEQYLLGVLRAAFSYAEHTESFEASSLFSVEFADGSIHQLTLHVDDEDEDEDETEDEL